MRFSLSLLLISCVIAFVCAFQAPRLVLSSNRVRSLSSLSYQNDENGDQPPVLVEMSNEQVPSSLLVLTSHAALISSSLHPSLSPPSRPSSAPPFTPLSPHDYTLSFLTD